VATVFFREDGTHDGIPLNERASGPDIDLIKRVPRRVCIVSGPSKVHSLRGALAAGLITDLIVDEGTARALVALDDALDAEAVVPVADGGAAVGEVGDGGVADGRVADGGVAHAGTNDKAAPEVVGDPPAPPVAAPAR
jgi:hypothetical protein